RSVGWYWRQVLTAIAIGCYRNILVHLDVVTFAALWSMLTPAWLLAVAHIEEHYNLNARFWQMAWPWSTVCELGFLLAANLIFIWAGIVTYLIPRLSMTGNLGIKSLGRGLLAGLPVLVALWVAIVVLPLYFLTQHQPVELAGAATVSTSKIVHLNPLEVARVPPEETWAAKYGDTTIQHQDSPLEAILDIRISTMFVRLPFFLYVLCTLWSAPYATRFRGINT
ncbi:MAG: hypothetical protein WAM85_06015, partial [Terracidiphilus sp.]